MSVYTKRGDGGMTSSCISKGLEKSSEVIEAIGDVDELNSFIGLVVSFSEDRLLKEDLTKIQEDLFVIGSILGGSDLRFYKTRTKRLEKEIDKLEKDLPPVRNFIFPGGTSVSGLLHCARSIARRTERSVVRLSGVQRINEEVLTFLNRLSDTLFMYARRENSKGSIDERIWSG